MQNLYLDIAYQNLLTPYSIDNNKLGYMLSKLMSKGANYADLYFQYGEYESWILDDGIIKAGSYSIDKGVGVRSVYGDKTAFSYTDQISQEAISQAIKTNISIGSNNNIIKIPSFNYSKHSLLYTQNNPINNLSTEKKIELLQYINTKVRQNQYIKNVIASLNGEYEIILIARDDGKIVADIRPLVKLSIKIMVEKDNRHESGSSGGGGRFGYEYFSIETIDEYINDALLSAYNNLESKSAPAGTMPVVLGAGWPAVLLHEAIGHGLEADFNRKGSSAFSNKIGQRVASKGITIVDDGTLEHKRGSISIDDEGNPSQYNVLIEDGILVNYLQDEMNANLMNLPVTGNGRRESYASPPIPRMTNTYMLNGQNNYTPQEIISSVKHGIYATHFEGGQVDITNGKFVFTASQAFLIENGKITTPLKGVTLIGSGSESLKQISMIGNDTKLDSGVGVCGKAGQSVAVGVGQPTLLIDNMTVGGTA